MLHIVFMRVKPRNYFVFYTKVSSCSTQGKRSRRSVVANRMVMMARKDGISAGKC